MPSPATTPPTDHRLDFFGPDQTPRGPRPPWLKTLLANGSLPLLLLVVIAISTYVDGETPDDVPWYRGTAATLALLGLPFLIASIWVHPWKAREPRSPLQGGTITTAHLTWRILAVGGTIFFAFFGDRLGDWFRSDPDTPGLDPYFVRIVMTAGFNIILAVSLQLINGFSGQFSLGHAGFMAVGAYMAAYPTITYSQRFSNPTAPLLFYIVLGFTALIAGAVLYGLFMLIRASRKIHSTLPAILMLLVFVWLLVDVKIASSHVTPPMYLVWSKSFDWIARGFSGAMSSMLPHANRVADMIPTAAREPITFLVVVLAAACCAAIMGFVVGLPALRLRGDYLAIATLGMAEIIRIIIQNSQPLGGALGLTNIPKYTNFAWLYGFAVITVFVIWRIAYSSQGRAIVAVREDEIAAAACGVDPTGRKVTAFVIGAFFGGVAGALFALHERNITPGFFNMAKSIETVVMVTLGGLGSISGAILAAAVLTILPELLREPPSLGFSGWVIVIVICAVIVAIAQLRGRKWLAPVLTILIACALWETIRALALHYGIRLSEFRMIIYSLSLVLMMLLRPQGLLGGRELWPKRLSAVNRMPTATEDRQQEETVLV